MPHAPDHPLRVCHIVEATTGGVARQIELVARTLPQKNIIPQFIVSTERDPTYLSQVKRLRAAGHSVEVVPMVRSLRPIKDFCHLWRLRRILRTFKPDLVHTHSSKAGYLGRRAAHDLGLPSVHTPHVYSFEWSTSKLRAWLFRRLERSAARWCDRIILLSDMQMERTYNAGIGPAEKLVVIPNGVDPFDFPENHDSLVRRTARARIGVECDGPIVGMAARLEPQKGIGTFLRAAASVHQKLPHIRFAIAGEGCLEELCKRRAKAMGLEGILFFCGHVQHMKAFYHAIDCFVLASLWEGLPYVILEAQSAGLAVIATATCGAEAVIEEGETGLLVPIGDEVGLATAIERVIQDQDLAHHLGAWGKSRMEEYYTLEAWAEALVAVYHTILHERSSRQCVI